MTYFCCDERRRNAVDAHPTLNGIDFLEVSEDQRVLTIHFLKPAASGAFDTTNIRIEGGERIRNVKAMVVFTEELSPPSSPPGASNILLVIVSEPGDFSAYTLRLVRGTEDPRAPDGFDPLLSAIDFSFKVACPSEFDCEQERVCPPEPVQAPDINYLAKDYASFRRLLLDRFALLLPAWSERNAADLGIVLVELLAYVGDYLSYQQDAVATEAYLGTARRRISVRRHARLVDYFMHSGANARAWVHFTLNSGITSLDLKRQNANSTTKLLTRVPDAGPIIQFGSREYERALLARPVIFELLGDATLYSAHNRMNFYTWGDLECCLPKGSTRATLRGAFPRLNPGQVLIFMEVRGPETGLPEDANAKLRQAVMLKRVALSIDPLNNQPVTEIEWAGEDALAFPLCISSRHGGTEFADVSVALGNIVLAGHGNSVTEDLDAVPDPNPALTRLVSGDDRCDGRQQVVTPPRFRPKLAGVPLTHTVPLDPKRPPASAAAAIRNSASNALPAIYLKLQQGGPDRWEPKRDLLGSAPDKQEFVAEVENDGTAYLRFGDDQFGSRPPSGTMLRAFYRTGNGTTGNIGANALYHLVSADPAIGTDLTDPVITAISNPLPARGGVEPETIEEVRQNAPSAFRVQERAVTPADYAEVAGRCDLGTQRAAATFRWTGSWRTVFLTVDRAGGVPVDSAFEDAMIDCLDRYRMAGHDLEVDGPQYVPLELEMQVCLKPGYFKSDVKAALLEVFRNRDLPDGRRGVFHPDNFTFGQPVYLSPLYAAAQQVAGVASVVVTKFQRQGIDSMQAINDGKLLVERLEIARMDNDANFPERGVFRLVMEGGQ